MELLLFVPTYLAIAVSPGLCMMMSFTVGMTAGLRRAAWLVVGELAGVMLVGVIAIIALFQATGFPALLVIVRYLGGGYLVYVAYRMVRANLARTRPVVARLDAPDGATSRAGLAGRGFSTAVTNPKGWVFLLSFLPPFLDLARPMFPQAGYLLAVMLVIEALSMAGYAAVGAVMGRVVWAGDAGRWGQIVPGLLIGTMGVLLLAGVI